MINSIDYRNNITFTGKTYSKKAIKEFAEITEYSGKKIKKIPSHIYHSLVNYNNKIKLEQTNWGYKAPYSNELKKYVGSLTKSTGYSTEAGGYGGGWIMNDINVPLSTKDIHTCALVNLINENTGKQLIYHVYDATEADSIKTLIKKEFPRFTKVNIMPGDNHRTNTTVNNIIEAVDKVNPKAMKTFYHAPVENPEVVAINGELQYLDNINPNKMSFKEIDQYHY